MLQRRWEERTSVRILSKSLHERLRCDALAPTNTWRRGYMSRLLWEKKPWKPMWFRVHVQSTVKQVPPKHFCEGRGPPFVLNGVGGCTQKPFTSDVLELIFEYCRTHFVPFPLTCKTHPSKGYPAECKLHACTGESDQSKEPEEMNQQKRTSVRILSESRPLTTIYYFRIQIKISFDAYACSSFLI